MDVASDIAILRNNKRIVAGQFRKEIKKVKTQVRRSLLHSYLQCIRLEYIMLNSQVYNVIINRDKTHAYELLQHLNDSYDWKIEKHYSLIMDFSTFDELIALHGQVVAFAKNILKGIIHNETAFIKSHVDEFNRRIELTLFCVDTCLNQTKTYKPQDLHGQLVDAG